jgi:N-acyl-D-amino-acid deacylase
VQEGGLDATLGRLADPGVRDRLRREWFPQPGRPLEAVRISYIAAPEYREHEGRTLGEAARHAGARGVGDFVCDLLVASGMAVGCVAPHLERSPGDVAALMRHPAMMGGSDGIYTGSRPHPRGWGCFARYLGPHVRDERTWSLETAVERLAAHPARRFGLRDRGLLVPGFAADVVVFDPATISDRSTFEDGRQLAVGMEHVLVNGEVVLQARRRTAALPGRGLQRR